MTLKQALEHRRAGRLAEAEAACRELVASSPFWAEAFHVLGMVLLERGQPQEAAQMMERSVGLAPAVPIFRLNLAGALGCLGRYDQCMTHLGKAMLLGGGTMPELHNHLGATLQGMGRIRESVEAFRNAIRLRPEYAEAHYNLGQSLEKEARLTEAAEAYRSAVRLKPDYSKSAYRLAGMMGELGSAETVIAALRQVIELHPRSPAARSSLLYVLHYSDRCGAESIADEHREWGRIFCDPLQDKIAPHANDRSPDRRLRIGYVSPDLREHTVTKFVTAAIEHHDREDFELYCYSDAERPDHVTERLKQWAEHWHDTRGLGIRALESMIREEQIDILVDLRGHAADNRLRLFARKPAPVQMNMVGYFNTTGLSAMDYRLTDGHMDPLGQTEHLNCETLLRIEPSCWCYSPEPGAPTVTDPPVLANGYITFGSLNKVVKVSEYCAKLWARVLAAVPNSKLLVSVSGDGAVEVRRHLSANGIAGERIEIVGKVRSANEYLERYGKIDIALDTWPFNGITTTCEGLWMGVPCVSLTGGTSVSRAGKSILHAAGLGELATESPEAFVAMASELARDVDRLAQMRRSMRECLLASPVMDHRGFARNLEAAYRRMWRAWCGSAKSLPRQPTSAG